MRCKRLSGDSTARPSKTDYCERTPPSRRRGKTLAAPVPRHSRREARPRGTAPDNRRSSAIGGSVAAKTTTDRPAARLPTNWPRFSNPTFGARTREPAGERYGSNFHLPTLHTCEWQSHCDCKYPFLFQIISPGTEDARG